MLLFGEHSVKDGSEPVLEFAVVIVWDDEISDPIHAFSSEIGAIQVEFCEIGLSKTLDEVLLDASSGGDDSSDVLMFDKMQYYLAKSRRYEI